MTSEEFRAPGRITNLNPQFDRVLLGAPHLIDWMSDDGERQKGILLLPSSYRGGTRYPLIVWIYGGVRLSERLTQFGLGYSGPFDMQLLATRGYAVLLPDTLLPSGIHPFDLAKMVLPGVNKVIDMGVADADRLGIMGHSFGGYSTLSIISETTRFRAAVDSGGFGDLPAYYGEMDASGAAFGTGVLEDGIASMGGTPWKFRERYLENSPVFYLDRVGTPLLIVHGATDTAVDPYLAEEIFVDLRRLGKRVEYARYEGEGHSPSYWGYSNQLDYCDRVIGWFDKWLKK
jgi:dipeptidyl aminopeptidase/acylaminoacyl peptidase